MNIWDPNARLADTQMMPLASTMTHEEARDEEVKRVMGKEENEPLYIRLEIVSPMYIIKNHNIISNDAELAPKYLDN